MSLRIRRSDWFIGDLEHYAAWYQGEASWEVAERYLRAVTATPGAACGNAWVGPPGAIFKPDIAGSLLFPG